MSVRLGRASIKAYNRGWVFVGMFVGVFIVSLLVLAYFDLLPEEKEVESASAAPASPLVVEWEPGAKVDAVIEDGDGELPDVFMTTITFFIVSIFGLVVLGAHSMLSFFESRPQVTAFFKDDALDLEVENLKTKLSSTVAVDNMKYISKNDALDIYKKQNADNPLLLEMVTADILPASLEVSAKNASDLEKIAGVMQSETFVEEVVFQKDVIDTLRKWVTGIRTTGIALSSLLILASLATIVIILGLKFTARKTEINTLSLLGATSWYIRSPFVSEGMIYGVTGAIFGWGLSYLTLLYLTPNIVSFLGDITLLPVPIWIMMSLLGAEVLLASLIGALASLIATRRYGR